MRVAIVGLGVAGSYLAARLQNMGHDVVGYERYPLEKFESVCAWGTCQGPMRSLAKNLGLNFEDYILHDGKEMLVEMGRTQLSIKLRALITFDKKHFTLDMMKGIDIRNAQVPKNGFPTHKYDVVVDATGLHRPLLPPVKGDIWIPCLQYLVKFRERPYDDFYIEPFPGLTGYAWYFPLGDGYAHVGAGDIKRRHIDWIETFLSQHGGEPIKKVGRPIRVLPPTRCEPFYQGNIVGVGEAVGTIYPVVGEGIIPSLQSAETLAQNWGDWEGYRRQILRQFGIYERAIRVVESALNGRFSLFRQFTNIWDIYRHMKNNVDRYGLEIRLGDILPLVRYR